MSDTTGAEHEISPPIGVETEVPVFARQFSTSVVVPGSRFGCLSGYMGWTEGLW